MADYYKDNNYYYRLKNGKYSRWMISSEFNHYHDKTIFKAAWLPYFPSTGPNTLESTTRKIKPKVHKCAPCKDQGCSLCVFDPFAISNIAKTMTN